MYIVPRVSKGLGAQGRTILGSKSLGLPGLTGEEFKFEKKALVILEHSRDLQKYWDFPHCDCLVKNTLGCHYPTHMF